MNFEILWISSTPMMPDGFRDFPGVMRTFPDPQECSEHLQSDSTFEKHWFSKQNLLISPVGPQNWSEAQSMMKSMVLDRQSELSGQPVLKFNRKHPETSFLGLQVLSGVSRSRNTPKFLNVHILYKSFKPNVRLKSSAYLPGIVFGLSRCSA